MRAGSGPGRPGLPARSARQATTRCGLTGAWDRPATGHAGWPTRRPSTGPTGRSPFGQRPGIDPLTAADGIDEWLGFLAAPALGEDQPPLAALDGRVLHLHATDEVLGTAGEWLIRPSPAGVSVAAGHGRGDVAVRGQACDLLLLMMRRLPPGDPRVEVLGEPALLDTLLAATAF